jgi:hypothetical protein
MHLAFLAPGFDRQRWMCFDLFKSTWKKPRVTLWIVQAVLIFTQPLLLAAPSPRQSSAAKPDTGSAAVPVQPLPFSHKTHIGFHLSCTFCHANPEPGNQMTLPAAETCMGCHARVAADKPSIQQLAKFAQSKEPIPWKPVYSVPAFVYWSHRTHLQAGITCEMCHGDVAQMEVITKTTNVTTMAGCVACHRRKDAPTGCETCHESQSSFLGRPYFPGTARSVSSHRLNMEFPGQ